MANRGLDNWLIKFSLTKDRTTVRGAIWFGQMSPSRAHQTSLPTVKTNELCSHFLYIFWPYAGTVRATLWRQLFLPIDPAINS